MRSFLWVAVVVCLFGSPVMLSSAQAADKKKDAASTVSVTGKISAEKADVDKFSSAKLAVPGGKTYNIVLNELGNQLVKQYEGISVLVGGTVEEKGTELWLTVKTIGDKKPRKK